MTGKHPGGRPPIYDSSYHPRKAEQLCKMGATDAELAEFFDVTITTINQWKLVHEEFSASFKMPKETADNRVKRSLYHKAMGYTYETTKVFNGPNGIVKVDVTEHVPPDTTAQKFWLINRCKDEFREKQETALTGADGGPVKTENVVYSGVLAEEDKSI